MTKLLEQALEGVRALPAEQQDELARVLMKLADLEQEPVALSADEREAIATSKAAAENGDFATDEKVRSTFRL